MSEILKLTSRVFAGHQANPPAQLADIRLLENHLGCCVDPDWRQFFLCMNGARLFPGDGSFCYRFLGTNEVARVRELIFGEDSDECGPSNWFGICDLMDTNYVAANIDLLSGRINDIRDCFHEDAPSLGASEVIATGFAEFLSRALDSKGRLFWL